MKTTILRNRLESTKEELMKILNRKIHVEMKKKWVEEAVQNLSREEIQQFHAEGEEEILNSDKEFKFLARQIVVNDLEKFNGRLPAITG